jgi:SAM-dependent methyltransferase
MERDYEALNVLQTESEVDPFTEERYRQFHRFLPRHVRSVLDVGCNTGRGGAILKSLAPERLVYGLDAVQTRLERLPVHYAGGYHGLSTAIPMAEDSCDAIVAGEFIEHLYAPDVPRTLGEFFRVLRMRGRLLMTTPNTEDMKRKLRGDSILGGSHVSQHVPSVLKIQMQMAGFSRVRIYGSGKVSRYVGAHAPLFVYGSYLIMGDKY